MDKRTVLIAARAKIADPSNWTNDAHKLDNAGPHCMVSACAKVTEPVTAASYFDFQNAVLVLSHIVGAVSVPRWNDTHTHAEVLAAFDKAIASLTPKQTDIAIFTDMLSAPLVEHQSAVDTCGNG